MFLKFLKTYWPFFLVFGFYVLFPNQNTQIDSWYYSACVKHHHDLFNHHHLLYNWFARGFFLFLKLFFVSIEALTALRIMNAMFACFSLIAFFHVLLNFKIASKTAVLLSLLAGFSFGFWRFATDAETYIIPIFFALNATFFLTKLKIGLRDIVFSSILISFAVLFHQIQIWWCFGLLFGVFKMKNIKFLLVFSAFLGLIPLIYFFVYSTQMSAESSFISFLTGEYSKGNANLSFDINAIILLLINFFRTFFQLHGYMIEVYYQFSFFFLFLFLIFAYFIFKSNVLKHLFKFYPNLQSQFWFWPFILAFLFNLLFALLSDGNAEFMVALPFLLILIFIVKYQPNHQKVSFLVLILFVWNLCFGILPKYFYNIDKTDQQVSITIKNPKAVFIWSNKSLIENQVNYLKGFKVQFNYKKIEEVSIDDLKTFQLNKQDVFTDVGLKTSKLSRAGLIEDKSIFEVIQSQKWEVYDSFDNLYGKQYILKLSF